MDRLPGAPLAATLLHLGEAGVGRLVDHCMGIADRLLELVDAEPELEAWGPNRSGVVVWRHRHVPAVTVSAGLRDALVSTVDVDGAQWLRSVAANPMADPDRVVAAVLDSARRAAR